MPWISPSSKDQPTLVVNLHETDNVFVASNVVIASSDDCTIKGNGSNHQALVYGTVVGSAFGFFTINLGDAPSVDHDEFVHVMAGGHVETLTTGVGVSTYGYHSEIINDGLIASPGGIGVLMRGSNTDTHSTLINNGLIEGNIAIARGGTDVIAEDMVIKNSGTIRGETSAFGLYSKEDGAGRDLITNTGKIYGEIELNTGDDLYDGRRGFAKDAVSGGAGDDRIYGGKERNILQGDDGQDNIVGGGGGDQLSGGTGSDHFIFKTIGDSTIKTSGRDVILDFSQAEADRIDLSAIDADTTQKGKQHFDFIGAAAFSDDASQLRFEKTADGTYIYGDVNGDGKADFAIALHPLLTMHAADFML